MLYADKLGLLLLWSNRVDIVRKTDEISLMSITYGQVKLTGCRIACQFLNILKTDVVHMVSIAMKLLRILQAAGSFCSIILQVSITNLHTAFQANQVNSSVSN